MIKKLLGNLEEIPGEFADSRYDNSHLEEHETVELEEIEKQRHKYSEEIKYDTIDPCGEDENQIWEQGYFRGYQVAINDVKDYIKKELSKTPEVNKIVFLTELLYKDKQ